MRQRYPLRHCAAQQHDLFDKRTLQESNYSFSEEYTYSHVFDIHISFPLQFSNEFSMEPFELIRVKVAVIKNR